jgi:hypothetical protein
MVIEPQYVYDFRLRNSILQVHYFFDEMDESQETFVLSVLINKVDHSAPGIAEFLKWIPRSGSREDMELILRTGIRNAQAKGWKVRKDPISGIID